SRRRHTRFSRDWSSDVCSSDLGSPRAAGRSDAPPGRRAGPPLSEAPDDVTDVTSRSGRPPVHVANYGRALVKLWERWCTGATDPDRKSTRLNSSHVKSSYAVFC